MAWRAAFLFPLVTAAASNVREPPTSVCNSTFNPVAMELGETGVLSVDSHGVTRGQSSPCRIKLEGCEACRIRLDISTSHVTPACQRNDTDLPKYPACVAGCASLVLYEPAYVDVTLRYHFGHQGPPTYTSISSSLALMFCPNDVMLENATYFTVHFYVQEKQQIFSGSPADRESWGVLASPNFPEGYAVRGEVYRYILRNSRPRGKVKVTFTDWDMAPSSRIEFYSHINGSQPLSMYFGSSARPVLFSPGPALYMVFHPEVGINVRADNMGFKARYDFIPGDVSFEPPHTDCGMYYKYLAGGLVDFSSTPSMGSYLDCVWVVTKHSAFNWSHIWLRNFTAGEGHAYLLVRSGVTSDGPVVANISSSFNDLTPAIKFEGHSGFYLQLLGNNTAKEYVSFTFTAFNPPKQDGSCSKNSEFRCEGTNHCIDSHLVCDDVFHCVTGADEHDLCKVTAANQRPAPKVCRNNEFACNNGKRCVPHSSVCDHWLDCPDGSDEYSCSSPMFVTERPVAGRVRCSPEERLCASGEQCIAGMQYCDGIHHCWDHSDEIDCFLRLQSQSLSKAPWSILMPVGIALCVALFVCVMTLCIRGHLKNQHDGRVPYTSSSRRPAQGHARRQRRGRSTHSTGSEIPLTLNLSSSTSHATVAHLPDSPPSYEEAMRLSPEGCSVTGFPGSRHTGRGSPQLLSPPHYTSSHSEGASSSSSSQLAQACFVFPANAEQHGALVEPERAEELGKAPRSLEVEEEDPYEGIEDQPIYENITMEDSPLHKEDPEQDYSDDIKDEPIYMNEDEVNGTECNGKCPPLELTLVNGSLSQSRQCCHLPKGCSSAQSTLQRCNSLQLGPVELHSGSLPLHSAPYDNHTPHKLLLEGFPEEGPLRIGHPAMIAPPPRTTSLIASLLDKGGTPSGKLTRSYTASPASTLSWTERAGSGRSLRADKMLPLDSTFCHRVQRQTSDGQSSSTSTLAPSETA